MKKIDKKTASECLSEKLKALQSDDLEILEWALLKNFSTMRVGGQARAVAFPKTFRACLRVCELASNFALPIYVLGNGSNTLCSSNGFSGVVICTNKMQKVKPRVLTYKRVSQRIIKRFGAIKRFKKINEDIFVDIKEFKRDVITNNKGKLKSNQLCVYAECGVLLPNLSKLVSDRGYKGLEFACGIPASVGGAVKMNAGAFGGQMSNCICRVLVYNLKTHALYYKYNAKFLSRELSCELWQASYRKTNISDDEFVIGVHFKLSRGSKTQISQVRKNVIAKRAATQNVGYPSLGSVFKRVQDFAPSAFIDKCGLKGLTVGGAQVSKVHAGYIVNFKDATSEDILKLLKFIENLICKFTNIVVQYEINFLGDNNEEE